MICATYPLFAHGTEQLHFGLVAATCAVSAWNGTNWYASRFRRLAKAMDALEAQAGEAPPTKDGVKEFLSKTPLKGLL